MYCRFDLTLTNPFIYVLNITFMSYSTRCRKKRYLIIWQKYFFNPVKSAKRTWNLHWWIESRGLNGVRRGLASRTTRLLSEEAGRDAGVCLSVSRGQIVLLWGGERGKQQKKNPPLLNVGGRNKKSEKREKKESKKRTWKGVTLLPWTG